MAVLLHKQEHSLLLMVVVTRLLLSRTVNWTSDLTPPIITATGTTTTLGCNPSASDINAALGTATATDACSTPTITSTDGSCSNN